MRSQLTRTVFRKLLSNEGLTFKCPTHSVLFPHHRHAFPPRFRSSARRTMFGFSLKPSRQPKKLQIDPGMTEMVCLTGMTKIQARPPPSDELIKGWKAFFRYKSRAKVAVNSLQAQHVLGTFKHLQATNTVEEGFGLSLEDLRLARTVMMAIPKDNTDLHNEFARLLYAEIRKRTAGDNTEDSHVDLRHFVTVLTLTDDSVEARSYAEKFSAQGSEAVMGRNQIKTGRRLWTLVLSGFAKENNESELLKTAQMAEAVGVPYTHVFHEIMTTFYASRNDREATKRWYGRSIANSSKPSPETISAVLKFCIRNNELEWCKSVFRELLECNPSKETWDIVFQWAAGALGKGVEDVERMMEVMARRNPENESIRPDVETINGLVELAMSLNDPYLAERYIALGQKSGIRPNARTFILQMNYRVSANDLTGAQVAYEALQAEETLEGEDIPAINNYIRALCASKSSTFDQITSITADLDERNARLEADTVASLCIMYLQRDALDEVVDTLHVHSLQYPMQERAIIREAFVSFCLDRNNSTTRVWDAYTILRQLFQETDISTRTQIMNEFFQRKRSDMACHAFGHMRQQARMDRRPVLDTYIQCFEGIAHCEDREGLDIVHNMFKLDSNLDPSTKLYNSLMVAYTACDDADRALDFWDDITNSIEGPTYGSLEIVFRACGKKPFGDAKAREIWHTMRRMEIEVTREVFAAYVGALAGQVKIDEAKEMVERMEKDLGFAPDVLTLGTIYNLIPGQNHKDIIETWAKKLYPSAWAELEKLGQTEMEEGHRLFNMRTD